MDEKSPKISFIPKGSLVREESFLERPRSRSAIGVLAIIVFVLVVLGYGGLYFYNSNLEKQIVSKLGEVQDVQKVFSGTNDVASANDFSFRAEIVGQLLASHIAVSPVLDFLSANTLSSIMYSNFSLTQDNGSIIAKIAGEAPTYSSLAYQEQVLSQKTNELSSFAVTEVNLTQFGTVSFTLVLVFKPEYLSYANSVNGGTGTPVVSTPSMLATSTPATSSVAPVSVTVPSLPIQQTISASGTQAEPMLPPLISGGATTAGYILATGTATSSMQEAEGATISTTTAVAAPTPTTVMPAAAPQNKSFFSSFLSWFKFW